MNTAPLSFKLRPEALVTALMLAALAACSTKQPSNSPATKAVATTERSETDMKPGGLLAGCQSLKAGGSYTVKEGAEGKEVSFFLDRDGSSDSIRRLRQLLSAGDYSL